MIQIPITKEEWNEEKQFWLLELEINADLPFFKGHFPSHPIVPGAFQLQWVLDQCQRLGLAGKSITQVNRVKFKSLMLPNTKVMLKLTKSPSNKISFTYFSNDEIFSSGSLNT
ncbi:MAG: thioester dehydrase [SAR324 cluster bacterium]|nr:thioester dehydrase [SAR324 cluster bacterium]